MKNTSTQMGKAVVAMDHLYKAKDLLERAGDQATVWAEKETYRHFAAMIGRIIIDDHGDAGLEPFIRGMEGKGGK